MFVVQMNSEPFNGRHLAVDMISITSPKGVISAYVTAVSILLNFIYASFYTHYSVLHKK